MSKCEQCIVRQLNSLKELSKEELLRVSNCKTSKLIKKGEALFEEGDHLNGVFCIQEGVCKISKMSGNGRNQIIGLIQKTIKQRLAETLLYLNANFFSSEKGCIELSLSRKDYADIIGAALESTIRLLTDFKKKGIIAFIGKHILVLNMRELEKIASGFENNQLNQSIKENRS
jgi:CRP-like cAMP-binding protein